MSGNTSEGNKRVFERSSCRIPCEVCIQGEVHRGFVLNMSASGIFMQTNSSAANGCEATISIRPTRCDTISISAVVVRSRKGHRSVTAIQTKGIGFAIKNAPEAYFALIADLQL